MNLLVPSSLVLTAYLAVFIEAYLGRHHELLGATLKLLPGLMVYAALTSGPISLACLGVLGGLLFDSLSANPLGITILPLFSIGMILQGGRELILREQPYAQFVLGAAANLAFVLFTLVLLLMMGRRPLFGLISLIPLALTCVAGGLSTIFYFRLFDRVKLVFSYKPLPESSFRPDREIKRGRA